MVFKGLLYLNQTSLRILGLGTMDDEEVQLLMDDRNCRVIVRYVRTGEVVEVHSGIDFSTLNVEPVAAADFSTVSDYAALRMRKALEHNPKMDGTAISAFMPVAAGIAVADMIACKILWGSKVPQKLLDACDTIEQLGPQFAEVLDGLRPLIEAWRDGQPYTPNQLKQVADVLCVCAMTTHNFFA